AVPGDPAGVGGAPPAIFFLEVKDPLQRRAGVNLVAAVCVQDALRLARCAGGVEDEQRVFGVHYFGLALSGSDGQRHQVVPPVIAIRFHLHSVARSLEDDDVFHHRAAANGSIRDLLQFDDLAAQPRAVLRDEYTALGVLDPVGQRLLGETTIHDAVHGPD